MGRIIPYVMEKQKMKTQTSIEYVYIEVASFRGPLWATVAFLGPFASLACNKNVTFPLSFRLAIIQNAKVVNIRQSSVNTGINATLK